MPFDFLHYISPTWYFHLKPGAGDTPYFLDYRKLPEAVRSLINYDAGYSSEYSSLKDAAYQASVLGRGTVRVAVEAAIKQGWERFIGEDGAFVGMTGFGASAPADVLYREFGITAEAVVAAARARL
jgi:hypothetical protein